MAKFKNNGAHKAPGASRYIGSGALTAQPKVKAPNSQARVAGAVPGFGGSLPNGAAPMAGTSPYNTILLWMPNGPVQDTLLCACHQLKAQARLIDRVEDVLELPSLAVFVDPEFLTAKDWKVLRDALADLGPDTINLVFVGPLSAEIEAVPFAHHWQESEVTVEAVQEFLQGLRQLPACMTTRIQCNPHGQSLEETLLCLVPRMPGSFGAHFLFSSLAYVNFIAYRAAFDYYEALGARYPQAAVDHRLSRYLHGLPHLLQPEGVAPPPLSTPGYTPFQNWRRVEACRSGPHPFDGENPGRRP